MRGPTCIFWANLTPFSLQNDEGTAPPFTFDDVGGCGALQRLQPDGAYDYSELHYTVDLAFHQVINASSASRSG